MTSRPWRLALAFAAVLTVAACQNPPPPVQKLPPISFADQAPIQLNVGRLEIVSEFQATGAAPNVEHLMPVSPEAAVQRWAQDRLRPMGRSGTARVVIKDAHVVEESLRTDKGLTGMFKREQAERYEAGLTVVLEVLDERSLSVADINASANRTKSLPEGVSVNDRDKALYDISNELIRDINRQMDGLIRSYLGKWVM